MTTTRQFVVDAGAAGTRLDVFLARQLAELAIDSGISRAAIQRSIVDGAVTVNQAAVKPSARLRIHDQILVRHSPARDVGLIAEAMALDILHEDDDILVVDKPPGLVVHPAAGHARGTLVNAILHHCPTIAGVGGERRPGIVHRLDKETSGVMVVAKNDFAMRRLVAQFKARTVRKEYLALVHGRVQPDKGIIDRPIGRHRSDRKRMSSLRILDKKRPAVSEWQVERRIEVSQGRGLSSWVSLVRVLPKTGRTHQIRVHMTDNGFPLVGDKIYGWKLKTVSPESALESALRSFPRQALHAEKLTLEHVRTGATTVFHAPLADDMRELFTTLTALELK